MTIIKQVIYYYINTFIPDNKLCSNIYFCSQKLISQNMLEIRQSKQTIIIKEFIFETYLMVVASNTRKSIQTDITAQSK